MIPSRVTSTLLAGNLLALLVQKFKYTDATGADLLALLVQKYQNPTQKGDRR
jgi:hypothetical protein